MSVNIEKLEKLAKLFAKCVEINGMEKHNHSDNNNPNIFFDYSGHVSHIRVSWYINGCKAG